MREIKFRAWNNKARCWYPVDHFALRADGVWMQLIHDHDDIWRRSQGDMTFVQFTGLRDKNGVEIYEGDVFSLGGESISYIVEFHDSGFSGRQIGNQSRVGLVHWNDRIEVIGNIYEHSHLLER